MSLQPVTLSALFLTRAPIQIHNIHLKDRISSTTNLFGSRDDDEIDDMSFSFSFQSPSPVDNNTKEQIVPTSYVLLTVLINFFLSETSSTLFDALFFGYILLIKSLPLSQRHWDLILVTLLWFIGKRRYNFTRRFIIAGRTSEANIDSSTRSVIIHFLQERKNWTKKSTVIA